MLDIYELYKEISEECEKAWEALKKQIVTKNGKKYLVVDLLKKKSK